MELFLLPFSKGFVLSAAFIILFLAVPLFQRAVWRSGSRHARKQSLSRLGGIALILAFLMTFFSDPHLVLTKELIGLAVGALFIACFGLWDDIKELGWKVQIFFQVGLALLIFIFGMRIHTITNPFGGVWTLPTEGFVLMGFIPLLVWLVIVMNSMNWLDGIDGLCGSVTCITLLTIFGLSLKPEVNQPPIALVAMIGAGAVCGFLFFNVYPAKIIAGTVGSMFLGFLVAVLAIIAGTKIATALLVLALPIADALWVIGERIRAKKSIFQADERHLHYKLRELGWSERKIVTVWSLVTGCIALVSLNTQALGKFVVILVVLGIVFSFLWYVERKMAYAASS